MISANARAKIDDLIARAGRLSSETGNARTSQEASLCEGWLTEAAHVIHLAVPEAENAYRKNVERLVSRRQQLVRTVKSAAEILSSLLKDTDAGLLDADGTLVATNSPDDPPSGDFAKFRAVYDDLTDQVLRSSYAMLSGNLQKWFERIDRTPSVAEIVDRLQRSVKFEPWLADFNAQVRGGGRPQLPDGLPLRLWFFRAARDGIVDVGWLGFAYLGAGSNKNNATRAFTDQIFRPMARELRTYLAEQLASPRQADTQAGSSMSKQPKQPIKLETTFNAYTINELIGEGGAGRVFAATSADGAQVAVKVLTAPSMDKRRRFKNEISFLAKNTHPNIVTVEDFGVAHIDKNFDGPFYVMKRYDDNLRRVIGEGIAQTDVLKLYFQILDGVEAAHMQNVVHRDLKPENILYDRKANSLAIADFGVARFTEDHLATLVETTPAQRLANFLYAAPEQRVAGRQITRAADIYALGLMLNQLFTGEIPHGTDYKLIGSVAKDHDYLDAIVARMIKQNPADRISTIAELKALFQKYQDEQVSLQKISSIDGAVIRSDAIDVPLADEPPKLINADWNNNRLTLTLDRPVTNDWITALRNMGSFTSVAGIDPGAFSFNGKVAIVSCSSNEAQPVIDYFKTWLPRASQLLKQALQQAAIKAERDTKERLKRERDAEEHRLQVNRKLQI